MNSQSVWLFDILLHLSEGAQKKWKSAVEAAILQQEKIVLHVFCYFESVLDLWDHNEWGHLVDLDIGIKQQQLFSILKKSETKDSLKNEDIHEASPCCAICTELLTLKLKL